MVELIGLLMIEHRLIEQIIQALDTELYHISHDNIAHPLFIYSAVDFFKTYADRFHHGKEVDILFVELSKKPLDEEHKRIMGELEEEHRYARRTVGQLVSYTEKWSNGDVDALPFVAENLKKLCELYPRHILKEDTEFFLQSQEYFNKTERLKLLEAGRLFDQNFANLTYQSRMKSLMEHG
jgi:hemerythrin-like domain-containing protein